MSDYPDRNAITRHPAAVALGRLGGLARAAAMTPEQRTAAAQQAGRKGGWPKGRPRGPRPQKNKFSKQAK